MKPGRDRVKGALITCLDHCSKPKSVCPFCNIGTENNGRVQKDKECDQGDTGMV